MKSQSWMKTLLDEVCGDGSTPTLPASELLSPMSVEADRG
jgi:hypothetical protein